LRLLAANRGFKISVFASIAITAICALESSATGTTISPTYCRDHAGLTRADRVGRTRHQFIVEAPASTPMEFVSDDIQEVCT